MSALQSFRGSVSGRPPQGPASSLAPGAGPALPPGDMPDATAAAAAAMASIVGHGSLLEGGMGGAGDAADDLLPAPRRRARLALNGEDGDEEPLPRSGLPCQLGHIGSTQASGCSPSLFLSVMRVLRTDSEVVAWGIVFYV